MKQLFSAAAILILTFLVSCDSKSDNKEQIAAPSVLPASTNPTLPGTNDSLAPSNQGVTLNPQHGEPGKQNAAPGSQQFRAGVSFRSRARRAGAEAAGAEEARVGAA